MKLGKLNLLGIDFSLDASGSVWEGSQSNNLHWEIDESSYMKHFTFGSKIPDDLNKINIVIERAHKQIAPSFMQENAVKYFIEKSAEVRKSIGKAVHEDYTAIYECLELESYKTEVKPCELTKDIDFLSDRIFLRTIVVHSDHNENTSYSTFLFDSDWDIEHGFDMILHQARVISTGGVGEAIQDDIHRGPVRHHFGNTSW